MLQTSRASGLTPLETPWNRPRKAEGRSTQLDLSYNCLDGVAYAVLPLQPPSAHAPRFPGRNGHTRHSLHPADSAAVPSPRTRVSRLGDLRHYSQRIPQAGGPAPWNDRPVRAEIRFRHRPGPRKADAGRLRRAPGACSGYNPQKNVRPSGIFNSPLLQMNASTEFPL
jgi:hypothetical protein